LLFQFRIQPKNTPPLRGGVFDSVKPKAKAGGGDDLL
jgi:hypothetical protein